MKASSQMVVDPTRGHGVQRRLDVNLHLRSRCYGLPSHEELECQRRRELRRVSPAAIDPVDRRMQVFGRPDEQSMRFVCQTGFIGLLSQVSQQARGRVQELVSVVAPEVGKGLENLGKRWHAVARGRGEVGPSIERGAVRSEPDTEWPASPPCHGGDGLHVDGVEIGPLFPVDFDADEEGVQQCRRLRIGE